MIIKKAEFVISNTNPGNCPTTGLPEFAFIGRSNVGKSSLINMLVNRKSLAKTSATPGKTQTINHFIINDAWYLVDLPGYGYASVGKTAKQGWPAMIETYIKKRETLQNTFVLIDSRLEPQANDLDFINWIGKNEIPFSMVFTKIDKLSKTALNKTADAWAQKLKLTWEELPPVFFTSSEKKTGRDELLDFIGSIIFAPL
ncbi:MAG TPA: ribosome biogenesis GTP-binding protein YihA/YsxC [Cyclobacteriaceae bacterium]|nr:ribosome biogenesis GTP-binding protein YihA/YsxC [Cyclobacteriaceae bacterium]